MRREAIIASALVVLAPRAHGQEVDARLMTLLSGHADPRDGHVYSVVPAYQSITLSASELTVPFLDDVRLMASGWGEVVLGDPAPGTSPSADLDLGFIEARTWKRRVELRLGRQIISGGAARMTPMDGLSAKVTLGPLALTTYGGAPVTPRFGISRGDAMAGARLAYRSGTETEIAASVIDVLDDGRAARQDVAVDARYGFVKQLFITEYALFSLRELRFAEASAAIAWQPTLDGQATFEYRRTAPDLFLPRTSVLSVFSQETRDELGGTIFWRPFHALRLSGDARVLFVEDGTGARASGKLAYGSPGERDAGLELRVLHEPSSGFAEARLFGLQKIGDGGLVTIDLDGYWLEKAINGQQLSLTATATAGWQLAPVWRVVVTGLCDMTPLVAWRGEVMVKVVYNPMMHVHQKGSP